MKSVNSAAKRNFEARMKVTLTQVDKIPPYKKQRNKSPRGTSKLPGYATKTNAIIMNPEIIKAGNISIFLLKRTKIA
jgi:hypothetical protein